MKKNITALFISFVIACCCIASCMPQLVEAGYLKDYIEQYKADHTDPSATVAAIITVPQKSLSEYDTARRIGVGKFVQSAEGKKIYDDIIQKQNQVMQSICVLLNQTFTVAYRYTALFCGFCIYVTDAQYAKIKKNASVIGCGEIYCSTEPDIEIRETDTDTLPQYAADSSSNISECIGNDGAYGDGSGIVVAVIDTELDTNHEYFTMKEEGTGRLTESYVNRMTRFFSTAGHGKGSYYINEKLPYVCNYETYTTETYPEDINYVHGSHVSGIAVGNGKSAENSRFRVCGTAPNAQLVFMGNSSLKYEALLASMNDCMFLDVDVVNCSYGAQGLPLFGDVDKLSLERISAENMVKAGVVLCVAAGNANKYNFTGKELLSHPAYSIPDFMANAPTALTIASAKNNFYIESKVKDMGGAEWEVMTNQGCDLLDFDGIEIEYVPVPGIGSKTDFDGVDVRGKFALMKRGEITFTEKSQNAADAGAIGVIFYNNVSGAAISPGGSVLPGFCMTMADGGRLISMENKTLTIECSARCRNGEPEVSDFTSWGCTNLLTLKPDLLCFGGNIYSSVPDNRYSAMDGTSMASPQAAGICAILKQHLTGNAVKYNIKDHSDYAALIANLLMSTAHPVKDLENGIVISPRRQGSGIPNVKKAAQTPAYLYTKSETDQNRPKISIGDNPGKTGKFTFDFYIRNISDEPVEYTLSYDLISDAVFEDELCPYAKKLSGKITFTDESGSKIQKITVDGNSIRQIHSSIALSRQDMEYMNRYFENGTYTEGFIHLTNDKNPELTLSFMGFYGAWSDSPIFDSFLYNGETYHFQPSFLDTEGQFILGVNLMNSISGNLDEMVTVPYFSPNEDGVFDTFSISTTFLRPVYDLTLSIYNENGDIVHEQYVGDACSWAQGAKRSLCDVDITWDGMDIDGKIHDGARYEIEYSCRVTPETDMWAHAAVPIIVDTKAPEVLPSYYGTSCEGTEMLFVNAADNCEIQGALLIGSDGKIFSASAACSGDNGHSVIALNIPGNENYTVEIYDYAGNCTKMETGTALPYRCGDLNGDGQISGRDAISLLQYKNRCEIMVNEAAADVNADDEITEADVTLLLQYLAEWDIVLGTVP